MEHVNTEFAGITARGITLCSGSGDWGTQCTSDCSSFVSDFTSSSPYVLSAGAVDWKQSPTSFSQAVATSWSSGGFSNVFPRPKYQEAAVEAFLSKTGVDRSFFNSSGRAFPDWAAEGVNFQVVVNGAVTSVAGTSASTPSTASVISLLNEARFAAGLPSMGWAHPFLYQAWEERAEAAFGDIVLGNNQYGCCSQGFDAEKGYDTISGLGVPQFATLLELALSK